MEMPTPAEGIARFPGGLPGFEIVTTPTPVLVWMRSTTAIMGTLQAVARLMKIEIRKNPIDQLNGTFLAALEKPE